MIEVKDCSKRYGDVVALDRVSFRVSSGGIVGLLGHNGAGKTTMMKIMTGFIEPTGGRVRVGGVDVQDRREAVQRQIGYMPENAPLYPEMRVQEYLLMMAELRGVPKEERLDAVADAVVATGLEQWLLRPISTLSKGYRQRVGLAQAIVHQPDVLVLDEPTNGLDPVQIVEIRDLIRRLAEHSTVILSTHILSEIEALCDRVLVLIDGKLAADRPLDSLLDSEGLRIALHGDDVPAHEVAAALETLPGVSSVQALGADPQRPELRVWHLDGNLAADTAAEAAELVAGRGWRLGEVAAHRTSLEQVFRELMTSHVSARRSTDDDSNDAPAPKEAAA